MKVSELAEPLENIYRDYMGQYSRYMFLARLASVIGSDGMVQEDKLIRFKLVSQAIATAIPTVPDEGKRKILQERVDLFDNLYTVSTLMQQRGFNVQQDLFTKVADSFAEIESDLASLRDILQLDTSELERPYGMMCGDNIFTYSGYDVDGRLMVLYPKPEISGLNGMVNHGAVFVSSLEVLRSLNNLILQLASQSSEQNQKEYYSTMYHSLCNLIKNQDIMDSVIVLVPYGSKYDSSRMPAKVTQPRSYLAGVKRAYINDPVTNDRFMVWILD